MIIDIINIVLPVFLVIGLGAALLRIGLIDDTFLHKTNRLVYYLCLPLLLFYKIGTADFASNFNGRLILTAATLTVLTALVSYLYAHWRKYPPATIGAFSQGSFRGNLAYIGLAIAFNAYGEAGLTRAGLLMGFMVPVLNFCAIVVLLLPHRGNTGAGSKAQWRKQLLLNPLILASAAGIIWSMLGFGLPTALERGMKIVTGLALPLALIAIGGSFTFKKLKGDLRPVLLASLIKLLLLPAAGLLCLTALGLSGLDLATGLILLGAPAATANFIMAYELKGDTELAASIVMLSTLLSAVSYSLLLLVLRGLGL